MPKEQIVTKKYLDRVLDKKFKEHSQIIITAVDGVLQKRLEKVEERLGKKVDNVQKLIDAYVKEQETFKQEFVIMKEEMKQIKTVIKNKLGVEIRAI